LSWYGGNWLMVGIALFLLLFTGVQVNVARQAASLRGSWGTVPSISELSEARARDLYTRARTLTRLPNPKPTVLPPPIPQLPNATVVADLMRQLHECAVIEPISVSQCTALVLVYSGGLVVVFADFLLLRIR